MMLQASRRVVQILVILFLVALLCLNLYEGNKVKRDGDEVIARSKILSFIDSCLNEKDYRTSVAMFFNGNLWSLKIGDFMITDPLAALSYFVKSKRMNVLFFVSIIVPVFLTIILGRIYCGWLCPMNLFLEITDRIKSFLKRHGMPTADIRFPSYTKHLILFIGTAGGLLAGAEYFQLIYPPRLVSIILHDLLFGSVLTYGVWLVLFIIAFELLFSRRLWCRNICPGGTLYAYMSAKSFLKVEPVAEGCTGCFDCEKICPYELKPFQGNPGGECDRCGLCITSCREKVLGYRFFKATK